MNANSQKSNLKILVVSEFRWTKGVVYDIHMIAEGLAKLGHKVHIFDPGTRYEWPNPSGKFSRLDDRKGKVELFSPRLLPFPIKFKRFHFINLLLDQIMNQWIRKIELSEFMRNQNFDLMILYSANRVGPIASKLAHENGVPIIFRCIDRLYMLESNVFIRFILKLNEFRTYRRVSKFMVLTPNYRDYLVRLGGAVERMELLNFPLDTNKFSPRKMSKGEQQKVMLKLGIPRTFLRFPIMMFVGNFYSWGGLVEFLVEVSKHPQKSRFKVILVGDGPARDQINEVIKKYQLKSIVHITGYIQFDEIPNCIRVADVCFNVWPINKRTNEVFSAKIIQYLACGKPVITSNLSGIRRALDSSAGVIYKDSISGVLDGAVEMLADLHKCELLGKVGRKYVLKNHSINNVVSKVNLEAWHLNNIRELGKYAI